MICFKSSRDGLILQSSQTSRLRLQSSHISCTCRNFAGLKRRCAATTADLISYVVCLGFQGYLKYQASVSRLGGKFSQPSHLGSAYASKPPGQCISCSFGKSNSIMDMVLLSNGSSWVALDSSWTSFRARGCSRTTRRKESAQTRSCVFNWLRSKIPPIMFNH